MYQLTELPQRSGINTTGNGTTYQGVRIEEKIRRIVENKEPIEETLPTIYTPSNEGVLPAYDIRTDKWDIAIDAMDKIYNEKKSSYEKKQDTIKGLNGENKGQTTENSTAKE